jgi:molecular chaperone GrpE
MVKKRKQIDNLTGHNDQQKGEHHSSREHGEDMTNTADTDSAAEAGPETAPCEEMKLRAEIASLNDKYLRLYSEFDNYRKRTQRERADLLKTATSGLITQLLPILDDFDRANKSFSITVDIAAIREGVELIHGKFRKVLEQKGLEEIKALGEPFDTDLHEAITNLPADSDEMRGKVVDEIEKGYMLNGTVIRYAKVAVAN